MNKLIRFTDITTCILVFPILLLPLIIIIFSIKITSKGPILFWSSRVGKDNILFNMPKFRTMNVDAPLIATNLFKNPENYLTKVGSILRKSSLDELPQLWCILRGQMSFVGPRPALYNQIDLINLRTSYCVHTLTPGLTGWAQINGRDMLSIEEKVKFDYEYLRNKSYYMYLKIMFITPFKICEKKYIFF